MNMVQIALRLLAVSALATAPNQATAKPAPAALVEIEGQTSGLKSTSTALALSLFGTAVPMTIWIAASAGKSGGPYENDARGLLFFGSLAVGPSLGHFYAGHPGHAFAGIGVRSLALVGLSGACQIWKVNGNSQISVAFPLALISLVVGLYDTVHDIATAPASARSHNAKVMAQRAVAVSLAPIGSAHAPGLRVDVLL